MEADDWVTGDASGLELPAHPDALIAGGTDWLTRAFRSGGVLAAGEAVIGIADVESCNGGSTGRKLRLQATYRTGRSGPPRHLFVKFSRDFSDPIRDRARIQMQSEVRLARLTQSVAFPVPVPRCCFADFHESSGTGILITEEIRFGFDGIRPHREKCLDADLDDPFGHYRALLRANARLAGAHRAGVFPDEAIAALASAAGSLEVSDRAPYSADQLGRRIDRLREFASRFPDLLPPSVGDAAFLDRFAVEAPRFCGHEAAIARHLDANARCNALSHWNANIDNAWFWRDGQGELRCGLLDWGNARVMNIGVALAGSLMAAEPDFLVEHLDALIEEYCDEFARTCGEALDPTELRQEMCLHNACSGLLWLIEAPAMIQRAVPQLGDDATRFDPQVRSSELVRNQLHMLTNFLTLWQAFDFGAVLDRYLVTGAEPAI